MIKIMQKVKDGFLSKNWFSVKKGFSVKNDGIGLVEVILALGVSVIVITSLVSLSIYTVRVNLNSKLLLAGTKLANEELEDVRALREVAADWPTFIGWLNARNCSTAHCYINLASVSGELGANGGAAIANPTSPAIGQVISTGTGGAAETVVRYFVISDPIDVGSTVISTDNVIRVSVTTQWNIGGQDKYARVYTDLSNWR